jgi:hypothetical protein
LAAGEGDVCFVQDDIGVWGCHVETGVVHLYRYFRCWRREMRKNKGGGRADKAEFDRLSYLSLCTWSPKYIHRPTGGVYCTELAVVDKIIWWNKAKEEKEEKPKSGGT